MTAPDHTILFGVAVVPAIVGIVELVKQTGLSERFAPPLALALGVLAGIAQQIATPTPGSAAWVQAGATGIALGLAAAGLYSGTKTILPGPQGHDGCSWPTGPCRTDEAIPFVRPPRSGNYTDAPVARPTAPEVIRATPDSRPTALPFVTPTQRTPETTQDPTQEIPGAPRTP